MKVDRRCVTLIMAEKCFEKKELYGDISKSTVRRLLAGEECRPATVGKLARVLGVEVSKIVQTDHKDVTA